MRPLWQTTVTSSEDDGGLLRSIWLRKSREANTGDNFSREKRKRAPPKSREMPSPQEPVLDEAAEVSPLQTSPPKEWYKQKVHESAKEVQQLKNKVKTLQQKKRRLSKRIDASQDLIEQLKEQNLLSEKGLEVFQASFSPDIQQLLKRTHEKTNKYPPELRAFALTLHYYSPRAYDYVRAKFNNALPNQRTLREWYKAVNGDPGFTSESFEFIKNIVQGRDEPLVAAIMIDDMSIKKHVQLVGNKVFGYVDLGMEMPDDSLPEATNACVFMLVALNMRLKKARLQAYGAQRRHKAVAASFCPEQYGRRRVSAASLRYMGGYAGPPLQKF
ncbi:hypothetical protein HPB51_023320 [Rhipicephalus microplus]|uniref:Uncharacterized protein n=1 Tax=Rhipicephalus microplus TaxID=6941 RepID=A0A9J6EJB1_RHIMP|nr:hypothetical protein HPB51_023320 [Rhipicephalus microplus]